MTMYLLSSQAVLDALIATADDKFQAQHMSGECRPSINYKTGAPLEDSKGDENNLLTEDRFYTVRAWMSVTSYLLSDYKFLYE